ncbi:MAG: protein kinase, partial [Planctomycetales bacterium]
MPQATKHPSRQSLQDFMLGKLDENESGEIESHLDQCDACVARLDDHWTGDNLVRVIQQMETPSPAMETRNDFGTDEINTRGFETTSDASDESAVLLRVEGYEIGEELGRGGMGVVYRARHQRLNRDVALKLVLNQNHSHAVERERFLREAKTIASLRHPGIVEIHDLGEHQGRLYLALELVEGGSLRD